MTDAPRLTESEHKELLCLAQHWAYGIHNCDPFANQQLADFVNSLLADRAGREGADDLREKVRALADEYSSVAENRKRINEQDPAAFALSVCANQLRALLDGEG